LLLSKKALAGAYAGQSSTSDKLAVAPLIGVLPIYLTAIYAQKWLVRGLATGAGR
jgi:ABC-type maltose transport system permease subunit